MPKKLTHTVGGSILSFLKALNVDKDKTNELYRYFLNAAPDDIDTEPLLNRCLLALNKLHGDMIVIRNRPKISHKKGNCYRNAMEEMATTGNPAYIVLEATLYGHYLCIVPHAVNRDKDGNYYDTDSWATIGVGPDRGGFIIADAETTKQWYCMNHIRMATTKNTEYDGRWVETIGSYEFLLYKDTIYAQKCIGNTYSSKGCRRTVLDKIEV